MNTAKQLDPITGMALAHYGLNVGIPSSPPVIGFTQQYSVDLAYPTASLFEEGYEMTLFLPRTGSLFLYDSNSMKMVYALDTPDTTAIPMTFEQWAGLPELCPVSAPWAEGMAGEAVALAAIEDTTGINGYYRDEPGGVFRPYEVVLYITYTES